MINACPRFSGIALDHLMMLLVLFHRLTLVAWMILELMLSNRCLLIMPISVLLGLIFVIFVNPFTPVLPVTALDEPWPFFHFWRHHFWPKLAPLILNFCRKKRSFQWCPDQSDGPKGPWDVHKNAQKVEGKTQTKFSFHYSWLLHSENCPSWSFLGKQAQ